MGQRGPQPGEEPFTLLAKGLIGAIGGRRAMNNLDETLAQMGLGDDRSREREAAAAVGAVTGLSLSDSRERVREYGQHPQAQGIAVDRRPVENRDGEHIGSRFILSSHPDDTEILRGETKLLVDHPDHGQQPLEVDFEIDDVVFEDREGITEFVVYRADGAETTPEDSADAQDEQQSGLGAAGEEAAEGIREDGEHLADVVDERVSDDEPETADGVAPRRGGQPDDGAEPVDIPIEDAEDDDREE